MTTISAVTRPSGESVVRTELDPLGELELSTGAFCGTPRGGRTVEDLLVARGLVAPAELAAILDGMIAQRCKEESPA